MSDYRYHKFLDSFSDQDDLQLGAEATNLLQRKIQKSRKNGSSLRFGLGFELSSSDANLNCATIFYTILLCFLSSKQ